MYTREISLSLSLLVKHEERVYVQVGRTNCQGCNPVGISGLGQLDRKTYSILMRYCNVAVFNNVLHTSVTR